MHAADLGSFPDAFGGLFFVHIRCRHWFPNQNVGLADLNSLLADFYVANPGLTRITPLQLQQVITQRTGFPFLKGKAAQVRHLAEFGLVLANMHKHGSATRGPYMFPDNHRLKARQGEHLDLLVNTFRGLVQYSRSLQASPFQPDICHAGMHLYLNSLRGLHDMWRAGLPEAQAAVQPFHLRQKAHMLQHMTSEQLHVFGNPASCWCYRDEDHVGTIKRICARTRDPRTLESRVLQKIRLLEGLGHFV
jgi:hypothetical protein